MSDPVALEVLDVALTPLPSPLRLAEPAFLRGLREIEAQLAGLKVTDATSQQLAANLQVRLTKAGTLLDQTRKTLKAPFKAQADAIDRAAEGPLARIDVSKTLVKSALVAYDNRLRAEAAEVERKRQVELARLEALRVAEEKAAAIKTAELARLADEARKAAALVAPPVVDDFSFGEPDPEPAQPPPPKTETEKQIEAVRYAPVVAQPKPIGITYRTTLVPTVKDVKLLPEMFCERTPKLRAIISTFCAGWRPEDPIPVCPGVSFEVRRDPVASGKEVF